MSLKEHWNPENLFKITCLIILKRPGNKKYVLFKGTKKNTLLIFCLKALKKLLFLFVVHPKSAHYIKKVEEKLLEFASLLYRSDSTGKILGLSALNYQGNYFFLLDVEENFSTFVAIFLFKNTCKIYTHNIDYPS